MTPDESKHLEVGQRVAWRGSPTDLGTVIIRDWSGVHIQWDKGKTFCHHNEMGDVDLSKDNLQ